MKKIIYIMNVDWNWIKQRPHFIAERLAKNYQIKIVYQYRYGRSKLQKRNSEGLDLKPIYLIPKISGIAKLSWINEKIIAAKVKKIINREFPEIVYVTYPSHIDMIPNTFEGMLIYDCMDNHSAFFNNDKRKYALEEKEQQLMQQADKVLVSSQYLLDMKSKKYHISKEKYILVRNAYNGDLIPVVNLKDSSSSKKFTMAYIGTISSWFDWNIIKEVLQKRKDIELHLFGPIDSEIPDGWDNIIYHGTVEHSKLYDAIEGMDCLVMPFQINDIIEAVDPVKLYEYINFNKNIIVRKYAEIKRFDKFVYFYSDAEEFIEAIDRLRRENTIKYSNEDRINFLKKNTWDNRVEQIVSILR